MPKPPSNKLFKLIKSLTGAEKRYIVVQLNLRTSGQDNKYLTLFQTIAEQKSLDEEALKVKVYQNQPIESRKYSQLKAYLYDLLLNLLQAYDRNSSVTFKINDQLQYLQVLYKRGHYRDCQELIHKAKKTVYHYEDWLSAVALLTWEKQVAYTQEHIEFLDNNLARIHAEEKQCLDKIRNISTYQNILYQLIISRRKHAVLRSEEKQQALNVILAHPLLENSDRAMSHRALVLYYRIKSNADYSLLSYDSFYENSSRLIELMESYPHLLNEDISAYIFGMTNLMLACGLLGKYSEIESNLLKFKQIKSNSIDDQMRIFKHYNALKFRLCIETGAFEAGEKVLKEHLKEIKKYSKPSFERRSFYFQYFYISFGNGNYDKALDYLNHWLNLPRSVEREDLQSLARMLNLIIHYERNNMKLLDNLIRSTSRYLKKHQQHFEFEKALLHFFQKAIKVPDRRTLKQYFVELKIAFESLSQRPSEQIMLQYFDFLSWIDSKINHISFAESVTFSFQQRGLN